MSEERRTVLLVHASGAKARRESVPQVVNAHARKSSLPTRPLPGRVVHRLDGLPTEGKDPFSVLSAPTLDDRPCGIVKDHDVGPPRLEGLPRDHEHAAGDFRKRHFPGPAQTA